MNDLHPGDELALFILGNIIDLAVDIHMPMDAFFFAVGGLSPSHEHQHPCPPGSVLFIGQEILMVLLDSAEEFLWPMALFAGLLGRAQILDRCFDRTVIFIKNDGINLIGPGKFGTDEPIHAWADVAFNTAHAGMRRILISDKLRGHRLVGQPSPTTHRLPEYLTT